jgi:DNA-binding response OmpR family regulator
MSVLLVLTPAPSADSVLPALALLGHVVRRAAPEPAALLDAPSADLLLVDARTDLLGAKALCRMLRATGITTPLLAVVTEGGLAAVTTEWGLDDVVLNVAAPAEIEARLRLASGRAAAARTHATPADAVIRGGDLTIDDATYQARIKGRPLDLTFKEFELLKYLAQHPGRVFSRAQLLQEVWGYDYFGGTRTVDVHVRRLRAKLGPEHESLVGTVRNVGYKFVTPPIAPLADDAPVPVPR